MASLSTRSDHQKLGSVAGRKQCGNRRSEMRDYMKGNARPPLRPSSSCGLDDGAAGCLVSGRSRVHESGHRCDHAREDRFDRPPTQFSLLKCPTKGQFGGGGSVDADHDPRHGDDIGDGVRYRAHDHHRAGRTVDHPLTDRAEEKFLETSLATGPYDNQVGGAAGLDERSRW